MGYKNPFSKRVWNSAEEAELETGLGVIQELLSPREAMGGHGRPWEAMGGSEPTQAPRTPTFQGTGIGERSGVREEVQGEW